MPKPRLDSALGPLTTERILDTAEQVLRRHGPDKATVVDVARALQVSHGTVYRHFSSKVALREAVTARWLGGVLPDLIAVATTPGPAGPRLRAWLDTLIQSKQGRARDDPELFANYLQLAAEAREVVQTHRAELARLLTRIVADGVAEGTFQTDDAAAAGQAVMDATARFHDPAHAARWTVPHPDPDFEAVWALITCGLNAR